MGSPRDPTGPPLQRWSPRRGPSRHVTPTRRRKSTPCVCMGMGVGMGVGVSVGMGMDIASPLPTDPLPSRRLPQVNHQTHRGNRLALPTPPAAVHQLQETYGKWHYDGRWHGRQLRGSDQIRTAEHCRCQSSRSRRCRPVSLLWHIRPVRCCFGCTPWDPTSDVASWPPMEPPSDRATSYAAGAHQERERAPQRTPRPPHGTRPRQICQAHRAGG